MSATDISRQKVVLQSMVPLGGAEARPSLHSWDIRKEMRVRMWAGVLLCRAILHRIPITVSVGDFHDPADRWHAATGIQNEGKSFLYNLLGARIMGSLMFV